MDGRQIINMFRCQFCKKIARITMESECCSMLYCEKCLSASQFSLICTICKSNMSFRISKLAKRLAISIKLKCPNECGQVIEVQNYEQHDNKCVFKKIQCIFCSQLLRAHELVNHSYKLHNQQINKFLTYIHQPEINESSIRQSIVKDSKIKDSKIMDSKVKDFVVNKIRPSIQERNDYNGNTAYLGLNGKYYCRGKIKFQNGKVLQCLGELNCDKCMKLDIKNHGLPKNYLINPVGVISKYSGRTKNCYCGRNFTQGKKCIEVSPCQDCIQLSRLIHYGLYKEFI